VFLISINDVNIN